MNSISATALRRDIYSIINKVGEDCVPLSITNSRRKGAVLVDEDDWKAIEETLRLTGVPGMIESLLQGRAEAADDCVGEEALEW